MKTSHKSLPAGRQGFIVPLLLILVALFFIGGGSYAYLQTKPDTQPAVVNSATQATSTARVSNTSRDFPVATNILPNPDLSGIIRSDYDNNEDRYQKALIRKVYDTLTEYEKALLDRIKSSPKMKILFRNHGYGDNGVPSEMWLKYYDKETVVFTLPSENGSRYFHIYNINTLDKISLATAASSFRAESNNYIIFPMRRGDRNSDASIDADEYLLYYKKGARDFQVVPNSLLVKPETYLSSDGPDEGFYSDILINDSTKMLTARIFNQKILENIQKKTVQIKLP